MTTSDRSNKGPELRLIYGGLHCETNLGPIRIVASPEYKPPFKVDAVVAEEDTFLVLSADPVVHEVHEHPIRLMTRLIETRPEIPGSVLVKGRKPFKFFAIVHDLNQEPTWKEEWVERALKGILQETETRNLQSIRLPMLGTKHGTLEKERFMVLLKRVLEQSPLQYLKCIWLIVPKGRSAREIIEMLESEFQE